MEKDTRPVYLDLAKFRWPIAAIISILHRVSGVALFLALPLILAMTDYSLRSPVHFYHLQDFLGRPVPKLVLFALIAGLCYHMMAGIRHLVMDFNIGETLPAARTSARLVIGMSLILTLWVAWGVLS